MRSAQMCRIMLAVSLTFTLLQPLRAAAQESPAPTYTLPPKSYHFGCLYEGVCELSYRSDKPPQGPYACADKGPLQNYTKDRQDRIDTLQGRLLPLAEDEQVQRRKMEEAQHAIDRATKLPALRAAQTAYRKAELELKHDQSESGEILSEIKALQDEMSQTVTSYNKTVTSDAGNCQCYVVDERTGKCKCTKARWDRAVREGNDMRVCGGGADR